MKTFVVYTLARLGLFVAVYGVVWLGLFRTVGWNAVTALYTALIAVVVSSLLALVVLRRQRAALAAELAERSQRSAGPPGARGPDSAQRQHGSAQRQHGSAQRQHGSAQRRHDQAGEDASGVAELGKPGVSKDGNQR